MKKSVFSFMLLIAVSLSCFTLRVYAVPAKPTPLTVTLPDGTTLTVRLYGDESFHYYMTTDGYLLLRDDKGYFYYAAEAVDKSLKPSSYRANDIMKRTVAEKNFLTSLDKQKIQQALQVEESSVTRSMAPKRVARKASYPTIGEQKGLVVLVQFQDRKFTVPNPVEAFSAMLNKEGYNENGAIGSARDYFIECSSGQFIPEFDVYGPITLAHEMSYYGKKGKTGRDDNPEEMVIEACRVLDSEIDFREFDRDGDGEIDNVYLFYAGYGEASSGIEETVWPHSWDVFDGAGKEVYLDGVLLNHYACSNELSYPGNGMTGIGTFCHEFSHVLGLPDLYAVYNKSAFTPGSWSIMANGSYNNNQKTPPYYSVYERYALGWIDPIEIGGPDELVLDTISKNAGYIIKTDSEDEYFLLENRQQYKWDEYIPGHGMLIWHIDYNSAIWEQNVVNDKPAHQYVDIEEADGILSEATRDGDAFPGASGITQFTDDTAPNMRTWSGKKLNKPITDIEERDGIIYFNVDGGIPAVYPVKALPATEVHENSFVANWESNDDAVGYTIDVFTKEWGVPDSVIVDFTGSVSKIPFGWETNSSQGYGAEGFYGKAKPSLYLTIDKQYLKSPLMGDDIRGLSFWYRGLSTSKDDRIVLSLYVNDEWKEFDEITLDVEGGMIAEWKEGTEKALPKGCRAIQLQYRRSSGNVVIDDVTLYYGGEVIQHYLDGYESQDVGNTLSCLVKGVEKSFDYYYTVKAFNGEEYSKASNEIEVPILKLLGIEAVSQGDKVTVYTEGSGIIVISNLVKKVPVSILNMQGAVLVKDDAMPGKNRYSFNHKGLYIICVGGKAYKVML